MHRAWAALGKTCNAKWRRQGERPKKKNHNNLAPFFLHFFVIVVTTWNFLATRFMEKMLYVVTKNFVCIVACAPVRFYFTLPLIFTSLATIISHFLTAGTKFSCCSSNKIRFLCFFISRSFSPWASLACRLLFSFSLSFSLSIFQICGNDN